MVKQFKLHKVISVSGWNVSLMKHVSTLIYHQ